MAVRLPAAEPSQPAGAGGEAGGSWRYRISPSPRRDRGGLSGAPLYVRAHPAGDGSARTKRKNVGMGPPPVSRLPRVTRCVSWKKTLKDSYRPSREICFAEILSYFSFL